MGAFRLRPVTICIYFAAVIGIDMFMAIPQLRLTALLFGALSAAAYSAAAVRDIPFYMCAFAAVTFINPLAVALGKHALFYIGSRPYTFEALICGANNAAALVGALLWFRLFSEIMTSDKINSLMTAPMFSSLAAALTLTLRYVPEFRRRYREIHCAHKAAGLMSADTWFVRLKSELNVFFSLAVSSLELSAESADSMTARGYNLKPHSDITRRPWKAVDIVTVLTACAAVTIVFLTAGKGRLYAEFYPKISIKCTSYAAIAYVILCSVPCVMQLSEVIRWHLSKRAD